MQETITMKGKLVMVINSKTDWQEKFNGKAPERRNNETWVWLDKNGNSFELGRDFTVAQQRMTFPCKVYRLVSVSEAAEELLQE